jgi:heterodisulfide reductase subunit A
MYPDEMWQMSLLLLPLRRKSLSPRKEIKGRLRIGVYVCHCGVNIGATVDISKVVEFAAALPRVVVARDYSYVCSDPGQKLIVEDVEKLGVNRVVTATCSPRLHEPTFRKTLEQAGLNPYCLEIANIREQCSWVHDDVEQATEKAKRLVAAAVAKCSLLEPIDVREVPVTPEALVIGAGISGIQAALDIANAGFKVHLVEKEPSIGGHMAQLDKTFPTLDCSACILTPKMVEVDRHPNIELHAYSQVEEIDGYVGNFTVKIRHKASFVDWNKCNACDDCTQVCPVDVPSLFNMELSARKAIYRPFPQAVPNKFVIEKVGTPPCRATCPAGVNVQGYVALIAAGKYQEALALERDDNPFASVCGRVCSHPCETECKRGELDQPIAIRHLKRFIAERVKGSAEKSGAPRASKSKGSAKKGQVAVVGSGPAGLTAARDLARWGYSVMVFEAEQAVGGMLTLGIPAFRLSREAIQEDIDYIKGFGVQIKTNSALGKDFTIPELFKQGYQAVFLATGAYGERKLGVPGEKARGVEYALDLLKKVNAGRPVKVKGQAVVIGGGNSAVDAARSLVRLGAHKVTILYRRSRQEMPAYPEDVEAAEAEGVQLHFLATPVEVMAKDGHVVGLKCQKMKLGPPDESGRRRPVPVKRSRFTVDADVVVVAIGEKPDLSFVTKKDTMDTTSWGTLVADSVTLETSVPGVFAGGDVVTGPATIIEAIAAGKRAAVSIDRFITGVDLRQGRETSPQVVTEVPWLAQRPRQDRVPQSILPVAKRVQGFEEVTLGYSEEEAHVEAERCLDCGVCCECRQCEQVCEPGAIDHSLGDEIVEAQVGTIVVATGYDQFNPSLKPEFGYDRYENVISGLEFERLSSPSGPTEGKILINGEEPRDVAFILCVGSRDETVGNEYCSRVCCMATAKQAHLIKEKNPHANVTVFYTDVRAFGKGFEEFYLRVKEEGVVYRRGNASEIYKRGERLVVRAEDTLLGQTVEVEADLVVLAAGMIPSASAQGVVGLLRLGRSSDGFLMEAHPKLRPVDTAIDGIFLAGCCQGPKDIPDAVAQAKGAAASAIAPMAQGKVIIEPITAVINERLCSGCRLCEGVCEYGALSYDQKNRVVLVNEVLCKGCGSCGATCPSGAITLRHFTDQQILAQIDSLI